MTAFGVVAIATKNQNKNTCALCGDPIEVHVSTVGLLVFCEPCFWLLWGHSHNRERLQKFVKFLRPKTEATAHTHKPQCDSCEYHETHEGDSFFCTLCQEPRTCPRCQIPLKT